MIGSSLRFIRSVESCYHLGQFRGEIRFQVQVGESDERRRELYKYYTAILECCHVHFNFGIRLEIPYQIMLIVLHVESVFLGIMCVYCIKIILLTLYKLERLILT